MSQENVEIVGRFYAAFNSRDESWLTAHLDHDIAWYPNPNDLDQNVRRGPDEVIAGCRDLWESLENLQSEPGELLDAGEYVVAPVHHTARIRGSNKLLERNEAHLWRVRQGRIISLGEFTTREQALEAVGLRE
jgi:uncharacterized protein